MQYVFVSMSGTQRFNTTEEIPFEVSGFSPDYTNERNAGRCVPREELDNQPQYKGWIGPMWDGGDYRYETQQVYNMLSM